MNLFAVIQELCPTQKKKKKSCKKLKDSKLTDILQMPLDWEYAICFSFAKYQN